MRKLWNKLTGKAKKKTPDNTVLVEQLENWESVGVVVIHAESVWNNEHTYGTHLDGRFFSKAAIYQDHGDNYISAQSRQSDGRVYFAPLEFMNDSSAFFTEVEQFDTLESATEWLRNCKVVTEDPVLAVLVEEELDRYEQGGKPAPKYPHTRKLVGKVSDLFTPEPKQWGLRGDPYLWREMAASLADVETPISFEDLDWRITSKFRELTGTTRATTKSPIFIERYDQGGISSGMISPEFWDSTGLPELRKRYLEERVKQLDQKE